jgi:hypothetical protein
MMETKFQHLNLNEEDSKQTNLFTRCTKYDMISYTVSNSSHNPQLKRRNIMTQLEKIRSASLVAEAIIASFTGQQPTDAIAVRREELKALKKDEIIELLLIAEKPKAEHGLTVETVARAFMEAPELAMFTWSQVAMLVHRVLPESKTSSKSIASYASKRKDEWAIAPREKFTFDPSELMAQNG